MNVWGYAFPQWGVSGLKRAKRALAAVSPLQTRGLCGAHLSAFPLLPEEVVRPLSSVLQRGEGGTLSTPGIWTSGSRAGKRGICVLKCLCAWPIVLATTE